MPPSCSDQEGQALIRLYQRAAFCVKQESGFSLVFGSLVSERCNMQTETRESLQRRLKTLHKNLAALEEQKAKMGLDVTVRYRMLGEIDLTEGDLTEAREHLRQSLSIAQQLEVQQDIQE